MTHIRRALVVGGGIGGMCAGIALAQRGIDVVLIEKRPTFSVPGVGLGQPANSLRVLDHIGVLPAILDAGFQYDNVKYFDRSGDLIVEHRFLLGGPGIPAVCALTRADLHSILLDAATKAGVDIRLGTTIDDLAQDDSSTSVRFSDGTADSFDLVAGFDGIRSATRKLAFGDVFEPAASGYGAWRLQVPREPTVNGMEFHLGLHGKTGAMPLKDEVMYLFHICPESPEVRFDREDYADCLRDRLAEFGDYIADIREGLSDDSDIVYSPLEVGIVPPPWHSGRIVLGGDAAHTVPPHLTEGAGMALEDALVLADELSQDKPLDDALVAYARRRYARCAFVYTFSMQMLLEEQMIRTPERLALTRDELRRNGSKRLAAADRILNRPVITTGEPAI